MIQLLVYLLFLDLFIIDVFLLAHGSCSTSHLISPGTLSVFDHRHSDSVGRGSGSSCGGGLLVSGSSGGGSSGGSGYDAGSGSSSGGSGYDAGSGSSSRGSFCVSCSSGAGSVGKLWWQV